MCLGALFTPTNRGTASCGAIPPRPPLAPLRRGADVLDIHPVLGPQRLHVVVGGHLPQGPRHDPGAFDVHVAPPEDGLDALEHRQAPAVPQHRAQLRVHAALDDVVGCREGSFRRQGGATLDSRDLHAALVSARARCQEGTWRSVQAISTAASQAARIPSANTTRRASSTASGIGHMPQNAAVFLRNVRPRPGMSRREPFDGSRDTEAARSRAEVSLRRTEDAPQLPQRHLCDPAPVLPFLFIAEPQDGRLLLSMALLRKNRLFAMVFTT